MPERSYSQAIGDHILIQQLGKGDSFTINDIGEELCVNDIRDLSIIHRGVLKAIHTMKCIVPIGRGHDARWEIENLPNANTKQDWLNATTEEEKKKITPCGICEHAEATIMGSPWVYSCPILE